MAETNQDAGLVAGTQEATTSAGSQAQVSGGSELDVAKLQSTLDALLKRQDEIDARTRSLQGDKDKGVTKLRREVEEIQRIVAGADKLRGSGLELDQAAEEFDFRETVRNLKDQLASLPSSQKAAGNGGLGAAEVTRLAAEYDLDLRDTVVAAAVNAGGDLEKSFAKLAFNKLKAPSPDSAQARVTNQGRQSSGDVSVEQLTKKYQEDSIAARGNKSLLTKLKQDAKAAGVDVDSVVFT